MSAPLPESTTGKSPGPEASATFAISAVAKLTGISEHCLRIWERRYKVVEPTRTDTKRRRYTQQDVERLVLIKNLLDCGDTISEVAGLSVAQLQERSGAYPSRSALTLSAGKRIRIALIGERLPAQVDEARAEKEGLQIAALHRSAREFLDSPDDGSLDAVVFDYGSFQHHAVADMERVLRKSGASKGILVYGFAARPALDSLDRSRFVALRAPVDLHEIRIACADLHMVASTHETKSNVEKLEFIPHRYSVNELAQFASLPSRVSCECPHHLVSLIFSLNAFEKYSLDCESLNAEDAELHRYLHKMTSRARATVEEALAKVAKADKMEIRS